MSSCEEQFDFGFNTAKNKKLWCKKFEFWYESEKDGSSLDANVLIWVYQFPNSISLAQDTCLRNCNIPWSLVSKYFCFWSRLFFCLYEYAIHYLSFKTSWLCILLLRKIRSDNLCKLLGHFHSWRLSCVHVYVLLNSCHLHMYSCDLHLIKPEK